MTTAVIEGERRKELWKLERRLRGTENVLFLSEGKTKIQDHLKADQEVNSRLTSEENGSKNREEK